jgi:hypothetical protein
METTQFTKVNGLRIANVRTGKLIVSRVPGQG